MEKFLEILVGLLQGFGNTFLLFAITLVVSIPLGFLISFGTMSKIKVLRWFLRVFIWIIRGTPLMLQLLFLTFVPKYVFGSSVKAWAGALGTTVANTNFIIVCFGFIINYACYFSEIFRAGIQSIPTGQREAGKVLGFTKSQIFSKVILLQVIKRTLPPISNETITLVKDTVLAFTLSVVDLLTSAQEMVTVSGTLIPFFVATVFYLVFNGLLTIIFAKLEKRFSYFKE